MDVEATVREYIDKTVHMSLGTSRDNKPWVSEVHFAYDEDLNLYFCSMKDSRHCLEIEANPCVAGNIVKQHDLTESPHGIYFEGTAALMDSPSERDIERYCSQLKRDAAELAAKLKEGGRGMYKITVNNWYTFGKFGGNENAKNQLVWNAGKK